MTVSTLRVRAPADIGKTAGIRLVAGTRAAVQQTGGGERWGRTGLPPHGRPAAARHSDGQRVNAGSRALIRAWCS